jgi:formylglycine-generating enzyme required for sulfatase activity
MSWTPQLKAEFRDALLDRYRSVMKLQIFLADAIGTDLNRLTGNGNLEEVCYQAIEQLDAQGELDALYLRFRAENPNKPFSQRSDLPPIASQGVPLTIGVRAAPLRLRRYRRKNQGFYEELGEGVRLTMMQIPAGRFVMGAPEDEEESRDKERPQHEVSVAGFFMGRYPVTQAQWRAVAGYEPIDHKLNPDPSHFKGDNRPVEQVNWDEAQEFCRRLSVKSGREYRLPSEAEWEYACRAGTTTPFHFGETIDAEIVNYNAQNEYVGLSIKPVYSTGRKGEYRQETREVGQFPGNEWCLHDMHGNVWEWCEDDWHESYEGAPTNGVVWLEEDEDIGWWQQRQTSKMLRGGSWNGSPGLCRSACRGYDSRRNRSFNLGFRVVCVSSSVLKR